MERIDKLLAHEGLGSRKDIRKILHKCEVLVNGKQIFDPGFQINPETDVITVDGEEIDLHQHIYLMMNKIQNTVSSTKEGDHETVFDLLDDNLRTPYLQAHLHLIGRLDMDTEGLLLFTTNGELTHKLISPKNHISKTYFCVLEHTESEASQKQIEQKFLEGIEVGPEDNENGFKCEPAFVKWAASEQIAEYCKKSSFAPDENTFAALLTIYEGKYHQVKRMFSAVGNKVIFLKRISMGKLLLDKTLNPGEYKYLEDSDLDLLGYE